MKKILSGVRKIFSVLLMIVSIAIMLFTVVSSLTFNRNDRNLFGYKFFTVLSDSMSKTDFAAGDIVISKEVDPATLQEGDIITYQSQNTENYGEVVTHKIRRITVDDQGNPGFITYGTTTDSDDETVVTYSFVLGKYCFSIAKVGTFFTFLKSTPGYFICIFTPFMILILIQAIKSVSLFRQYKKEQKEEIDREKQDIAQERAKNEEMMKQLLEMQAKLVEKEKESEAREVKEVTL